MIPIKIKMPDGSIHSLAVLEGETIVIGPDNQIDSIIRRPKFCEHRRTWAQACEACAREKTIK